MNEFIHGHHGTRSNLEPEVILACGEGNARPRRVSVECDSRLRALVHIFSSLCYFGIIVPAAARSSQCQQQIINGSRSKLQAHDQSRFVSDAHVPITRALDFVFRRTRGKFNITVMCGMLPASTSQVVCPHITDVCRLDHEPKNNSPRMCRHCENDGPARNGDIHTRVAILVQVRLGDFLVIALQLFFAVSKVHHCIGRVDT